MSLQDTLKSQLAVLGIELDDETVKAELDFLSEMLRWNKTYNLTAITDPGEALEKHLVDSLTLLPCLAKAESLLDIGSGGGFPGIPIQIARPDLRVTSVDAVAKKITFQRHASRRLKLSNFNPWHGRVEQLPLQRFASDGFDLIVARAFASLQDLLELALPYLKPGGSIVAMKGADGEKELAEAEGWLALNGLSCSRQVSLVLPHSGARRYLLFFGFKTQDVE